jgi:hypothetical protein
LYSVSSISIKFVFSFVNLDEKVGLYAGCMTRVDVAFNLAFLSRFSNGPTPDSWDAVVEMLIYLWQTRALGLTYGGREFKIPDMPSCRPRIDPRVYEALGGLIVISDSSWKTGATYAGFFILFQNAAVDWISKLLKVMLSSSEAEIGAGTLAAKRVIYIRHFIGFVKPLPSVAVSHVVDNSALPSLTENLGVSRKTEHFRRWLHFMRYAVLHGYIHVHLAKTHDMHANFLTKVENLSAFFISRKIAMNL